MNKLRKYLYIAKMILKLWQYYKHWDGLFEEHRILKAKALMSANAYYKNSMSRTGRRSPVAKKLLLQYEAQRREYNAKKPPFLDELPPLT